MISNLDIGKKAKIDIIILHTPATINTVFLPVFEVLYHIIQPTTFRHHKSELFYNHASSHCQ